MTPPELTRPGLRDMSREQGYLAKDLYAVFTTPANGLGPVMEQIEAHLAFQRNLEARGILFGAGPLYDEGDQAWLGDGMVILRADSDADARRIAELDPMHAAGARTFTLRPWLLNEGTITVKIDFAAGTRELH